MAVKVVNTTVTGVGTTTPTVAHSLGRMPIAILAICQEDSGAGILSTLRSGQGFYANAKEYATGICASAASLTGMNISRSDSHVIHIPTFDGTLAISVEITSVTATDIVLSIVNNIDTITWDISFLLIGGHHVEADIQTLDLTTTEGANVDITFGFQPDTVFALHPGQAASWATAFDTDGTIGYGFGCSDTLYNQVSGHVMAKWTGPGATNSTRGEQREALISNMNSSAFVASNYAIGIDYLDDGLRINRRTSQFGSFANVPAAFLAIKGIRSRAGSYVKTPSTASHFIGGAGFTPEGVILLTTGALGPQVVNGSKWCFGWVDNANVKATLTWTIQTSQNPSTPKSSGIFTDAVFLGGNTSLTGAAAFWIDTVTIVSGGMTLTYRATNAETQDVEYIMFAEVAPSNPIPRRYQR